jgi:hypothetical protein
LIVVTLPNQLMKFLSFFAILLSALIFTARAACDDKIPAAEKGSFVTLKRSDGREFRSIGAAAIGKCQLFFSTTPSPSSTTQAAQQDPRRLP